MRTVWLIVAKDLRLRLRNRSIIILALIAPLSLAFVFDLVFSGLDDGERITFDLGVADLDGGNVAAGFTNLLDDLETSGLITVATFADQLDARAAVDRGDVAAAMILPPGLSTALRTGETAEIHVIGDVDAPTATAVAAGITRGYVAAVSTGALAAGVALTTGAIDAEQIEELAAQVATNPLASVTGIETDSAQLDLTSTLVAGMAVFFMFFVAGLAVTGILEERDSGTLPRLLISPASRAAILVGKAFSAVIIAIAAVILLMIASTNIMGADWGDPAAAVLLIVAAVLAATGIMSLVGGMARTAEQAGNLQAVVAVSMAMLGGSFGLIGPRTDTFWGQLSLLTPNTWFLRGLGQAGVGGVSAAAPAIAVLLAMGIVTGSVAIGLARKVLHT